MRIYISGSQAGDASIPRKVGNYLSEKYEDGVEIIYPKLSWTNKSEEEMLACDILIICPPDSTNYNENINVGKGQYEMVNKFYDKPNSAGIFVINHLQEEDDEIDYIEATVVEEYPSGNITFQNSADRPNWQNNYGWIHTSDEGAVSLDELMEKSGVSFKKHETLFQIGKWYRHFENKNIFFKYESIKKTTGGIKYIYASEFISSDRVYTSTGRGMGTLDNYKSKIVLLPQSELDNFLPTDHEDRKTQSVTIDSWCVKVTRENYDVVKKWLGNNHVSLAANDTQPGHIVGITKKGDKTYFGTHCAKEYFSKIISTKDFYTKIGHVEKSTTPIAPSYKPTIHLACIRLIR